MHYRDKQDSLDVGFSEIIKYIKLSTTDYHRTIPSGPDHKTCITGIGRT